MTSAEAFVTSSSPLSGILRRLAVGSAWNMTSVIVNRLLPNILVVFLAWFLNPNQLGVYSYIIASYTVLSLIADLGIAYSLQKYIQENPEETPVIASTALLVRLASSILLGALCLIADRSWALFKGHGLLIGLLLASSSFGTVIYVLNAEFKYKKASLLVIWRGIGWFVLSLVFVALGHPISGPIGSLAAVFVIVGLVAILLERADFSMRFRWSTARKILGFGALLTLSSAFNVLTAQIGVIALAHLSTDHEVGVFKLASIFGLIPMLLAEGLILPLLPIIKRSVLETPEEANNLIRLLVRYLSIIGILFWGAGTVLSDSLIGVIFGIAYQKSVWPMRILLGASFFGVLFTVILSISFMSDDLKHAVRVSAAAAVFCLFGNLFLIPLLGASGAALSLCAAYGIGLILIHAWMRGRFRFRPEWRKLGISALSGLETVAVLILFVRSMPTQTVRLAGGLVLAPIIYFAALRVQGAISMSELSTMIHIMKKKPTEDQSGFPKG